MVAISRHSDVGIYSHIYLPVEDKKKIWKRPPLVAKFGERTSDKSFKFKSARNFSFSLFTRSSTNFTNVFAFSVILFSFLVGCSGNWLPNSILFLTRVYHEPFLTLEQCTYLTTFNEIGKVFSILFGGYVAKRFGRKKMLIYIVSINFVSWIFLCSSTSTMFIYLARFVVMVVYSDGKGISG